MKKILLLSFVLTGCAVFSPLQRSSLIGVFHLIEDGKYDEAKEVVDNMIRDDETSQWARTWYARGILSQTAYQEGIRRNDKSKYELYPNQLYLSYSSFQNARALDKRGRLDRQLAPRYVMLANDFKKLGERNFKAEKYREALRAFEQAIRTTEHPLIGGERDADLVYNTALAAYEIKEWEKAIEHLEWLNERNYSTNASHLLYSIYIEQGDIEAAETVLARGIGSFEDDKDLILLLADLLFEKDETQRAIALLDSAALENPSEAVYHYTKGLIFQKTERYNKAIDAYKEAHRIAPNDITTLLNIATCYYNLGVKIEEESRVISNNRKVLEMRTKSTAAFQSAITWLDRAYEKNPTDLGSNIRLYQLYRTMGEQRKARNVQRRMNTGV